MGVLGALFSGTYLALSGGSKKSTQIPPINASSPDEADFIQYATRNVGIDRLLTVEQELLEAGRRRREEVEALNTIVR
jgi:hypothetical protein